MPPETEKKSVDGEFPWLLCKPLQRLAQALPESGSPERSAPVADVAVKGAHHRHLSDSGALGSTDSKAELTLWLHW